MQAWNAIRRPFSATKIEPSGVNQTKAAPEGRNRKFSISGLVGALIAYGLAKGLVGKGHGLEFCALALAIWFSFWAFKKLKIAAYLVPTLAATTAHGIIFLLAAALAAYFDKYGLFLLLPEITAIAALVVWVSKRPSFVSLIALLLYQIAAGLMTTIYNATHLPMEVFAIVMHLGMRTFEVGATIYAIYKIRTLNVPQSHRSMAEYYYVINNAVSKLGSNTQASRQTLYDMARGTLVAHLGQDRSRLMREQHTLEAAIREVENSFMMREVRPAL